MKTFLAAAVLLLFSLPAAAQPAPDTNRYTVLYGLHAGRPQKLSVTLGVGWMPDNASSGPFIALEPGLAGTRVSAGWTQLANHGVSVGARASYLRTYGDPWGAEPDANYLGVDGHIMVMVFTIRGGVACGGGDCMVTSSFGLLF